MKFRIPIFWSPSVLALEVEEALASKISCPRCGEPMKSISRDELKGGGHLFKLFCPNCNRTAEVKFVFTGPRLEEGPDGSFDLAYRYLLEACDSREFIDRVRVLHKEMEEHGWGHYVLKRLREDLTRYRLQASIDPKASMKAKKISEYLANI